MLFKHLKIQFSYSTILVKIFQSVEKVLTGHFEYLQCNFEKMEYTVFRLNEDFKFNIEFYNQQFSF